MFDNARAHTVVLRTVRVHTAMASWGGPREGAGRKKDYQ